MKANRNLIQICLLGVMLSSVFASEAQPVVTKVAAGENDTLLLKSDGSLWAMGANTYGELGDGTNLAEAYPEQIVAGGVTAIAVGAYHSLFLKSDGSLWTMGYNNLGQLGDGTHNDANRPKQIMPNGVTAIAAGANHSLFLKNDGTLWGMGDNSYGQLGGGASGYVATPQQILFSGVTAIAAGGNHELFIKHHSSGIHQFTELWAMGDNGFGQLGTGTTNTPVFPNAPTLIESYETPALIGTFPVTAIATGRYHSLFLKGDGSLWAMGYKYFGALGDGSQGAAPYEVTRPEQIPVSGVTAISAGVYHSLFLKNDGSLWAMGDNMYGELGTGTVTADGVGDFYGGGTVAPVQAVAGGVTAIGAGSGDSVFVQSDGSLWGMGAGISSYSYDGEEIVPVEIVFPPPPPLGITTYSNQPVVIFPTAASTGYYLQMTTNLASGNWVTAPSGIPFSGVQFTNAPPNAFFRLQPPH